MKETKYTVKITTQFKKDYKLAIKRGLKIALLDDVAAALAMGESLPKKNKDHAWPSNVSITFPTFAFITMLWSAISSGQTASP